MAMFHFRLKSDKKPNGTKISAVKHVEYIDREGSFAHDEQWKENNKFVGDSIKTAETSNVLGGLNALLYKTDEFGSIRNTGTGIFLNRFIASERGIFSISLSEMHK